MGYKLNSISVFYFYSVILISLFGGTVLFLIWRYIQKKIKPDDYGLLWFSLSLFAWSVGLVLMKLVEPIGLKEFQALPNNEGLTYLGGNLRLMIGTFFSYVNNACLLIGCMYFDHLPDKMVFTSSRQKWKHRVAQTCLIAMLISTGAYFIQGTLELPVLASLLDSGVSLATTFLVGIILFITFKNRGLKVIAFLSGLTILFVFVSQLVFSYEPAYKNLGEYPIYFIRLMSKTLITMVFFALATSWLYELTRRPKEESMFLSFFVKEGKVGISFEIKPKINKTFIPNTLSLSTYKTLLKFAQCRKYAKSSKKQYLVIKSKVRPKLPHDLKDHKEMERIIVMLNKELKKDNMLKKDDLFEKGELRHWRLRIAPDNIEINHEELILQNSDFSAHSFNKCPTL